MISIRKYCQNDNVSKFELFSLAGIMYVTFKPLKKDIEILIFYDKPFWEINKIWQIFKWISTPCCCSC